MFATCLKRKNAHSEGKKSTKCFNLIKLSIAALPTIAFGIFTIVFTIQQDASARATREQDQQQADEINRRILFKEYIDDMKELLFDDRFEQNINKSLVQVRIQTLTLIKNLDPQRKYDVILFLYENRLIRADQKYKVDLHGADLSSIEFTRTTTSDCNFAYLYLRGVDAENVVFNGCFLVGAVFEDAALSSAKFISCNFVDAKFLQANLTKAQFLDSKLYQMDFAGASLVQSSIRSGVFQKVNLTNADLYQSDISNQLLNSAINGGIPNIFLNTRFPNGSFSHIDNNNLIVDGRAAKECSRNMTEHWYELTTNTSIRLVNVSEIIRSTKFSWTSDCLYRMENDMIAYQAVAVKSYSLLIDIGQAVFNMSVFLGLNNPSEKDELSISIHFAHDEGSFDYANSMRSQ